MESAHRDDNTMNRMFSNIKDWLARDKAKWRRSARESQVDVQVQLRKMEGTKRTYSHAKTEQKQEKKARAQDAIEDRVREGVLSAFERVQDLEESQFE
jgi:hypothetical protein